MSGWVSAGRFGPHMSAAGGDEVKAVALYEWNVAVSAACFEAIHYVEVIVRNAIDRELRAFYGEDGRGIPWFLLPLVDRVPTQADKAFKDNIERVRRRLRDQHPRRETRDQILAGVDFGFWTALLHPENEELWRQALRRSFPHSSGRRKDVVVVLEKLRLFRNRLAHHDSLLAVDVLFHLDQMRQVLRWIDPRAEQWLLQVERVRAVHGRRPAGRQDVVVVAAKDAWPVYLDLHAYICQAGRSFQAVRHLGFYADREIKPELPQIRRRLDNVDWSASEVDRLRATGRPDDGRLATIIADSRRAGWTDGRYQVFELSSPGDADHVTLPAAVPHLVRGRGSAYTQGHRYVSLEALRSAGTTADLR